MKAKVKKAKLVLLSQTLAQGESAFFTMLFLLLSNRKTSRSVFSFFFFQSSCHLLSSSASFCPSLKFFTVSSAWMWTVLQEQQMMTQPIRNAPRPGFLYQTLTFSLGEAFQHRREFFYQGQPLPYLRPPPHTSHPSAITSPFNSSLEKQLHMENY